MCGKKCFQSVKAARKFNTRLTAKMSGRFRIYFCHECKAYHATTQNPKYWKSKNK